jgi:hypothetical protein
MHTACTYTVHRLDTLRNSTFYCHPNHTFFHFCCHSFWCKSNWVEITLISGFRRDVDEICGLLGYYTASCGNCLPTFRDNTSVPSSRVKSLDPWGWDRCSMQYAYAVWRVVMMHAWINWLLVLLLSVECCLFVFQYYNYQNKGKDKVCVFH